MIAGEDVIPSEAKDRAGDASEPRGRLAQPASAQTLEVRPDSGRVTVGDPVSVRVILRQYERDVLREQVPHPVAAFLREARLLLAAWGEALGPRAEDTRAIG